MNKNIRILQLIDSLDTGGAERMAINYANTLAEIIPFSALVTTRKQGVLKEQLSAKVAYLFLNKKSKVGLNAVMKLRDFVKQNKIDVIHAHSTSFFTAVTVKMICPKLRIVWHDHYGNSEFLDKRDAFVIGLLSSFFSGIISVNLKLKEWANKELNFKNAIYLPNFVFFADDNKALKQTHLSGVEKKRIVCLANLREQKNHSLLVKVATLLKQSHPEWTFHLVGKDFDDAYSFALKEAILECSLDENVFIYGSKNDIGNILHQSDIAILTSKSEGLPVALLEYGYYKKPVISTNVGEIGAVIQHNDNAILVNSGDEKAFYSELVALIDDKSKRDVLSDKLHKEVMDNYSERAVISKYLDFVK